MDALGYTLRIASNRTILFKIGPYIRTGGRSRFIGITTYIVKVWELFVFITSHNVTMAYIRALLQIRHTLCIQTANEQYNCLPGGNLNVEPRAYYYVRIRHIT